MTIIYQNKTKILIIGLALVTFIVITGVWWQKWRQDKGEMSGRENTKTFSEELSTSGKNIEIPEKFPKDLPIVESSLVEAYIRNPETKDIDTIFESKKTAKENFDYYLNYFKKNSWQIDEAREINENKPGKILTSKDGFVITLVFEEKENNGSKITISSTTINTKQLENIDIKGLRLK